MITRMPKRPHTPSTAPRILFCWSAEGSAHSGESQKLPDGCWERRRTVAHRSPPQLFGLSSPPPNSHNCGEVRAGQRTVQDPACQAHAGHLPPVSKGTLPKCPQPVVVSCVRPEGTAAHPTANSTRCPLLDALDAVDLVLLRWEPHGTTVLKSWEHHCRVQSA